MNVALLEARNELRVTTKNVRALDPGEALIRVSACGVCGTDVHIVDGTSRSNPPVILGHEYFGVVEEVSGRTADVSPGMLVAVDPNISCGTCHYCRRGLVHLCENLKALGVDIDGGMAEWCIVPMSQLYAMPADMSHDAGVFVEPVSCAVHGIDRAEIQTGDSVVVVGGGTIGLIMLQLARLAGAVRTILFEPLSFKRDLAVNLGATHAYDPDELDPVSAVMDMTGVGADVVIECVGKPETADLALRIVRKGGTVELFGVSSIGTSIVVEPHTVYSRELRIVGSHINPNTFSRSIELLRTGAVRVEHFPVEAFPLEHVHEALATQKKGMTIKCIVLPGA